MVSPAERTFLRQALRGGMRDLSLAFPESSPHDETLAHGVRG